jgi:hypothetical protein
VAHDKPNALEKTQSGNTLVRGWSSARNGYERQWKTMPERAA